MNDKKLPTLKRRHLGYAGLATVLIQYGVGMRTEHSTTEAVNEAMNAQLLLQRSEIERTMLRDYVRRDTLARNLSEVADKLDGINSKVDRLNSKTAWIEGYLKQAPKEVSHRRRPNFSVSSANKTPQGEGES